MHAVKYNPVGYVLSANKELEDHVCIHGKEWWKLASDVLQTRPSIAS